MSISVPTQARPEVKQTQCFIGGNWIPAASGKTFETIHPATEEVITQVAEGAPGLESGQVGLGHMAWKAETLDDLKAMVQDAVRCHFEEHDRPRMIRLHFVRDEVIPA